MLIALIFVLISIAIVVFLTQLVPMLNPPPNFPPGPRGIHGFRYVPLFSSMIEVFEELSKKYGKICGFYALKYPVVVINDPKLLKEGFGNDAMSGRFQSRYTEFWSYGADKQHRGIALASGEGWSEQRHFVVKTLRTYGFGKSLMEELIMDEVLDIINGLRKDMSGPISNFEDRVTTGVLNSLWYIVSGERKSQDNMKLPRLAKNITINMGSRGSVASSVLPKFAQIFPKVFGSQTLMDTANEIYEILKRTVNAHKETFDRNNPRDFIDAYLKKIEGTKNQSSTFWGEEGEMQLLTVLMDLLSAGGEPTINVICWAFLYLMMNSGVQEKVQIEIDTVTGRNRNPTLADRPRMPYTEAVIAETMRFASSVPLGVPRSTIKTMELGGYTIPKDTIVFVNTRVLHHDKVFWGDPENFRPERFLTSDGEFKGKEGIYLFSTGKRVCIGESLARDQIFLFLTGLLQKFCIDVDERNPPSLEPKQSHILQPPQTYNIAIRNRNLHSLSQNSVASIFPELVSK